MSSPDFDRWMPFDGHKFYDSSVVKQADFGAEGFYMRLLWEQWLKGSIPADVEAIFRLAPAKASRKELQRWWSQIGSCFPVDSDGLRRNPRCVAERVKAQAFVDKKRRVIDDLNRAKGDAPKNGPTNGAISHDPTSRSSARSSSRSSSTPLTSDQDHDVTPGDLRSPGPQGPPPEVEPRSKRARKRPAEPFAAVLARPEYAEHRASRELMAAFEEWIEHCGTAGSAVDPPAGPRAAALLNEAKRAGFEVYALAIRLAIAGNWQKPGIDAARKELASANGVGNGHAAGVSKSRAAVTRSFEVARAQGISFFSDDAQPPPRELQALPPPSAA